MAGAYDKVEDGKQPGPALVCGERSRSDVAGRYLIAAWIGDVRSEACEGDGD